MASSALPQLWLKFIVKWILSVIKSVSHEVEIYSITLSVAVLVGQQLLLKWEAVPSTFIALTSYCKVDSISHNSVSSWVISIDAAIT